MYSELYVKILGTAEFQLRPGNLPDNIFGTRHHIKNIYILFFKIKYMTVSFCDTIEK